jgi:putative transposase
MDGKAEGESSDPVRLAARLIIEEGLRKRRMRWGRDHYARDAVPGGRHRTGRVKGADGAIEYSAPQFAERDEPSRSGLRAIIGGYNEDTRRRCFRSEEAA